MKYRIKSNETRYRVVNLAEKATADIPVLPDELGTISKAWLIRWAEWVAAGRPEIDRQAENSTIYRLTSAVRNEFVPELHPRDPRTGKFVERSFNVPDDIPNFAGMSSPEILSYLDEQGEDIDSVLQDEGVSIDGVPRDADSLGDLSDGGTSIPTFESKEEALNAVSDSPVGIDTGRENVNEEQAKALGGVVSALDGSESVDLESLQEYVTRGRTKSGFELFRLTENEMSSGAGQYQDQYGFIELNTLNWEANDDFEQFLVSDGDIVENIAIHEMGHALHGEALDASDTQFSEIRDMDIPSDQLESEVSTYAAQNPSEAVAEMFVHQARGNELPDDLQALYEELNGPEPPNLNQ